MPEARRKQVTCLSLCLVYILVLGVVDYATTAELDLFLFYSVPVALTAWMVGRGPALARALLGLGTWVLGHLVGATPYSSFFYASWNTALRGGWLLLVALAIARIRADLDRERRLNAALTEAQTEVKVLRGLLPICAWCHQIRNADGQWETLEAYLHEHTDAQLTHGICPRCQARVEAEEE